MSERVASITVRCRCGAALFKYQKVGRGRLIKCFVDRLLADHVGIPKSVAIGTPVLCLSCGGRIGSVQRIHGAVAVKLNQGQIQNVRIG